MTRTSGKAQARCDGAEPSRDMVNEALSARRLLERQNASAFAQSEIPIDSYSKAAVDFIASTKSKTECRGRITMATQGNMKIHELL
jgi:hypothetical protein